MTDIFRKITYKKVVAGEVTVEDRQIKNDVSGGQYRLTSTNLTGNFIYTGTTQIILEISDKKVTSGSEARGSPAIFSGSTWISGGNFQ